MRYFLLALLIALPVILPLAACNTIEGMGTDISSAARGVKETINDNE